MNHLGYSLSETQDRFEAIADRLRRTTNFEMTFDHFLKAVSSIDFRAFSLQQYAESEFDIRNLVIKLLDAYDTLDTALEELVWLHASPYIMLRCIAEREGNRNLQLAWEYQDLVESGWAEEQTLMEIDTDHYILNHIKLYGRLQDYSRKYRVGEFDDWLEECGLSKSAPYIQINYEGKKVMKKYTLPTAVRNMIHHPENRNQTLDKARLSCSLEQLLQVAQNLKTPLVIDE